MYASSPFHTEEELAFYVQKANPALLDDFNQYEQEVGRVVSSNYQPVSGLSVRTTAPTGRLIPGVYKSMVAFENPKSPEEIHTIEDEVQLLDEEQSLLNSVKKFIEMNSHIIGEDESRRLLQTLRVSPTLEVIIQILELLGIPIEALSESLQALLSPVEGAEGPAERRSVRNEMPPSPAEAIPNQDVVMNRIPRDIVLNQRVPGPEGPLRLEPGPEEPLRLEPGPERPAPPLQDEEKDESFEMSSGEFIKSKKEYFRKFNKTDLVKYAKARKYDTVFHKSRRKSKGKYFSMLNKEELINLIVQEEFLLEMAGKLD